MNDDRRTGEVSRRDLLKKSAVAGGVIWATPMVLSSTAGAQAVTCPQGSCPTYHRIKIDSGEQPVADAGGTGVKCNYFIDLHGGGQCALPVPTGGSLVTTTCAQFNAAVKTVEDNPAGFPGNSVKIVLEDGFQFVAGFSKKGAQVGDQQCPGAQGSSAIITVNCTTAVFRENSHIELLYCGPT
jgi:hypothetical protein